MRYNKPDDLRVQQVREKRDSRAPPYTRVAMGIAALLAPFTQTSCYMPPKYEGKPPETFGGRVAAVTWNYGAIDDYLAAGFKEGKIGLMAQGIVLYPVDFLLDIGIRLPKNIVYDIPRESWRRAVEKEGDTVPARYSGEGNMQVAAFKASSFSLGALGMTVLNYPLVAGEGLVNQVVNRPLESILHTVTAVGVAKAISGNGSGGGGGGQQQPPPNPWTP